MKQQMILCLKSLKQKCCIHQNKMQYEQPHDKTNMSPAKTQISLGIRPG